MWLCENKSKVIAIKGEDASCFFIIKEGVLDVGKGETILSKQLQRGQGFGDLALLYNTQHRATVSCEAKCKMWAIGRKLFRETIDEIMLSKISQTKSFIDKISLFSKKRLKTAQRLLIWF